MYTFEFTSQKGPGYKDIPFLRITRCVIWKDGKIITAGKARQNSKDQDNKVQGQKYAVTNAIKKFPKEIRTEIWESFKHQSKATEKLMGENNGTN